MSKRSGNITQKTHKVKYNHCLSTVNNKVKTTAKENLELLESTKTESIDDLTLKKTPAHSLCNII